MSGSLVLVLCIDLSVWIAACTAIGACINPLRRIARLAVWLLVFGVAIWAKHGFNLLAGNFL